MLLGLLSLFPVGTVAVWNPRTSANYSSYHPPHFRLICEIYRLDIFNPLCVFIHSIKFLISIITSPFLILYNATNKDRIVTIIMIHCSFMFDSLLLYSAASWRVFLQHLAVKEHSSFFYLLNSDITGGVVHNYAFSCIYRHIGCR